MPAWMLTPAAARYQRAYVAKLVASGQWAGPRPSDEVLALAATYQAGQAAVQLVA